MLKTSQTHTGSPCWIFHSVRSLRFSRRYSFALYPALALFSSMDQKWYMDPDLLVQLQLLLSLSAPPLQFLSLMIWNTGGTCSWTCGLVLIWPEWAQMWGMTAHVRKQCLRTPIHSLCTQTSAEQWAGTLVCIKLSAIAAIICKSKIFPCDLFLLFSGKYIYSNTVYLQKYCA